MALRIGINGFGRIGRLALRVISEGPGVVECAGINDVVSPAVMAHLFKYDSTHGVFKNDVSHTENAVVINGKAIPVTSEKDPAALPWKKVNCDIVLECTGLFTNKESAGKHLSAGAKKVIISAPAKGDVPTFVMGVNNERYRPDTDHVVSNASCTTNCLAPIAMVLHEKFGIERGFMTTVHAYTNDQRVVDGPHKDLRRARSAGLSQIPTTTGAAKAVGLVLPELAGKLDGLAVRVPTANVSLVDLVCTVRNKVTAIAVNDALKEASEGKLKGILRYCDEELVSVDFNGDTHSSIVDAPCTKVIDNMVKVLSWYDNEIGFCHRMVELAAYMGRTL